MKKAKESRRLGFAPAKQAAEFFGISTEKVRRLAATRTWPSYCIGGRRVFDLDELVRIVKGPRSRGNHT